jgi:hypothetical protein
LNSQAEAWEAEAWEAEAWEADAVGQEAAVEEVVAVDAEEVVVARMLNYEHDEGMEWEVG